jgi:hypothetical protein
MMTDRVSEQFVESQDVAPPEPETPRQELVRVLDDLARCLVHLADSPHKPQAGAEPSGDQWEDESYRYFEVDVLGDSSKLCLDLNVFEGRAFLRIES